MDQPVNERWLQLAYLNAKGNVTKTDLKFPIHTEPKVDQEFTVTILDTPYTFVGVREESVSNPSDTLDVIYVVVTPH